jgi:hypothetical protein
MNKQAFFAIAAVAVSAFLFTSCVKEEPAEPAKERSGIWIGLGKRFNTCQDASFICIREDNISHKELLTLPLGIDEAVSEPVALSDGAIQLAMDVDVDRLSARTRRQLLDQRVMVLEEDVILSESLMRQAYENAGIPYNGQRTEILKGAYDIANTGGGGTAPQRIKITITVKDGTLTITIRW